MKPKTASLASPIIYGVLLIIVTLVLTVLYNLSLVTDRFQSGTATAGDWFALATGWVLGLAVIIGLILFMVSLARQIRLNQRQQNFIDAVTHELKSPLTSIKLHLETIQRRPLTPDQLATFTGVMLNDVDRLNRLIDHVLEAARVENAPPPAEPVAVVLRERVAGVVAVVMRRHELPEGAVRVEGDDVALRTDPVAVDLVLSNLLENAVKYSRDAVSITVRVAHRPQGGATITVADDGVGIPRGQTRRIFKRFHRVGSENTRIRPGAGLGLYIVKETVRQLRGSIRAESPGLNRGSVFTLTLPGDPHG